MSGDAVWIASERKACGPQARASVRIRLRLGNLDPRTFAWSHDSPRWTPLVELDWARDVAEEALATLAARRRVRKFYYGGILATAPFLALKSALHVQERWGSLADGAAFGVIALACVGSALLLEVRTRRTQQQARP